MAAEQVKRWTLLLPEALWAELASHLFPGDEDEHGAVIAAGTSWTPRGARLMARDLFLARDGTDYVPGERGYRMLTSTFVRDQILYCRDENLAYLAVHCHGGSGSVAFSSDDLMSHERGYPALREISGGQVVGGLVFAQNAVVGDLWLPDGSRAELNVAVVLGRPIERLFSSRPEYAQANEAFDRQSRIFGDRGQSLLAAQKVGVIGAGGAGSLLVEYLSRLGVGYVVVIDPDRIEVSNLPRIVGSKAIDALPWLESAPRFLRSILGPLRRRKVAIARRVAKHANRHIKIQGISMNVVNEDAVGHLIDCDYLFLAADSMQARLVFNALVHQYLIPGIQVGAKVTVAPDSGDILDAFSVVRPVTPDLGCLWCNGLISPAQLQDEALAEKERREQRYVDDPMVKAPSVITLNAVAASHAVDDYLFTLTGLLDKDTEHHFTSFLPKRADVRFDSPRKDANCPECGRGAASRLARGGTRRLPTRPK